MYNRYLQNKSEEKSSHAPCDPPSWEKKLQPCDRRDDRRGDRRDDRHDDRRDDRRDDRHDIQKKETSSLVSLFGRLLGSDSKGGLSRLLDENTLIVLLLLFFLLKDEDGIDHDLLILAGIFLLIGL